MFNSLLIIPHTNHCLTCNSNIWNTHLIMIFKSLNLIPGFCQKDFQIPSWDNAKTRHICSSHETWCFQHYQLFFQENPLVTNRFLSLSPVIQSFDVYSEIHLNKLLNKQWNCQRFLSPMWCHCKHFFSVIQYMETPWRLLTCNDIQHW